MSTETKEKEGLKVSTPQQMIQTVKEHMSQTKPLTREQKETIVYRIEAQILQAMKEKEDHADVFFSGLAPKLKTEGDYYDSPRSYTDDNYVFRSDDIEEIRQAFAAQGWKITADHNSFCIKLKHLYKK